MKEKVIDLELSEDGTYEQKKQVPVVRQKPKPRTKIKVEVQQSGMGEFFNGLDLSLDFVEGVSTRVQRLMKWKDKL